MLGAQEIRRTRRYAFTAFTPSRTLATTARDSSELFYRKRASRQLSTQDPRNFTKSRSRPGIIQDSKSDTQYNAPTTVLWRLYAEERDTRNKSQLRLKGRRGSRFRYYRSSLTTPLREPLNPGNKRLDHAGSSHRNEALSFGLLRSSLCVGDSTWIPCPC